MNSEHRYRIRSEWTGNRGTGTSGYRDYGRDNLITTEGKHAIESSADRTFHGDRGRWNPEELLVAALSECHMLSFLHAAVMHGVVVTGYSDEATGLMRSHPDGSGEFVEVTLHPRVEYATRIEESLETELHREANRMCFIARSVNFPVKHEPVR